MKEPLSSVKGERLFLNRQPTKFKVYAYPCIIHVLLNLNLNLRRRNLPVFLLIDTKLWQEGMALCLKLLKIKHVLQEKRAE